LRMSTSSVPGSRAACSAMRSLLTTLGMFRRFS
jgi:hypothetical protein